MITKEAIEAGVEAANKRYLDFMIEDENAFDEAVKAGITAAIAAMPGPAVRVRELEWEAEDNGWWGAKAVAFPGGYEVRKTDRGHVRVRGINGSWESFDGTLDEAKAAAQADYEARILSALTPAPDLASENERLRAALETIARRTSIIFGAPHSMSAREAFDIAAAALERT